MPAVDLIRCIIGTLEWRLQGTPVAEYLVTVNAADIYAQVKTLVVGRYASAITKFRRWVTNLQ